MSVENETYDIVSSSFSRSVPAVGEDKVVVVEAGVEVVGVVEAGVEVVVVVEARNCLTILAIINLVKLSISEI